MIDFSTLQGLTIPEGVVTQIARDGVVLWKLESGGTVILEVEKITSDTYAGETTYTSEEFILLDIYPKTNGTVNVTYGGLTKTITDTSGAEEPNAQQVFFGTFNGVSDSISTPSSGTLTIEGDCYGVGVGTYKKSSTTKALNLDRYTGVKAIVDFGSMETIPGGAFYKNAGLTNVVIPSSIKNIGAISGTGAFYECTGLISVTISEGVALIGCHSFNGCKLLPEVTIPSSVTEIGNNAFYGCASLRTIKLLPTTPPTLGGDSVFHNGSSAVTVGTQIIVPKGCVDAYKSAENWSVYADYIVEES